jgi:TorA maturation chaperone TorD
MTKDEIMVEKLIEELYLLNFLRHVFLKEPERELLEELSNLCPPDEAENEIETGLKLILNSCQENKERIDPWLEELAVEYARLFIGPNNPAAVPFASFYLSRSNLLITDETVEVRRRYLEAGVGVKEHYTIPEDHIAIELDFLYFLTEKILENLEKNELNEASRLFEIRNNFINDHMKRWVPVFTEKIIDNTNENFYKGCAFILNGLLSSDF